MRISFIGHGNAVVNIANHLKLKGFHLNGFYDDNLKTAIDMAIRINTKAYYDLEKIISDSDVIFLYDKDEKSIKENYFVIIELEEKVVQKDIWNCICSTKEKLPEDYTFDDIITDLSKCFKIKNIKNIHSQEMMGI